MASERKVVKAGYLIKSPPQEKLMAQWHRRYFILWSDRLMEYYSSHEHKPQDYLKTIDLSKCEDMVAPLPITNRPHVIKLSVVMGGKLRDYYLDCTTEEDMEVWVKCLAKVCGFSPVENEDEEDDVYSNVSSPEIIDQPVYQDIEDNLVSSFHEVMSPVKKPVLRAPLPSGRLKQSFSHDDLQGMYEEPVCDFNGTDNYHLLQDNGSTPGSSARSTMERPHSLNQEWYDDVGINDAVVYTMNKHPPPVWKPGGSTNNMPPPLPPNRRAVSSEPEDSSRRRGALPLPSFAQQVSPNRKPLPPPKPVGSTGDLSNVGRQPERIDMFGIKDNPVFRRKLEEKRQELYGPTTHPRSLSMGDGDELTQESYESVLFTVGDTPDPPALPSKTDSMRRSVRSPSPPPLPSRDLVRPVPQQSQVSPRHRGTTRPSDPLSPSTPPPLPSRELLDPTRPSITVLLARGQVEQEEAPPPVPLRQSSNRQRNSLPPDQLPNVQPPNRPPPQLPIQGVGYGDGHNQLRRRNSLPTSPTPSDVSELDRRKPIPIPSGGNRGRLEPPPLIQTSRSVPDTKPRPQPKPKTFRPAALPRQEAPPPLPRQDVRRNYDDAVPSEEATSHFHPHTSPGYHRYHAGDNTPQNPVDLAPRVSPRDLQKERSPKRSLDNIPLNPVDLPPRISPRDLQKERSPKRSPLIPSSKPGARDPLPPPSLSPTLQKGPKPKPPVKSAASSSKPAVPSGKPTVPVRKPALAEKPSLAQKPEKPAPSKKPVAAARNPAMVNSAPSVSPRKPAAPPTAPRRYRPSNDSAPSPNSPPPLLQAPPLANKHKPKPLVPKKPVPSLCS